MNQPAPKSSRTRRSSIIEHEAARSRRLFIGIAAVVLLVVFALSARPAYRKLKSYRANQFSAEAERFVASEQWSQAASKYRAALQLDPHGYRSLSGAARLATRFNRPEATDLWREATRLPQATVEDRQQYAAVLLKQERITAAESVIEELLRSAPDAKTLSLAAQFARTAGDDAKAIEFARLAATRAPEDGSRRFALAEMLGRSTDPAQRGEARQILWQIAAGEGPAKKAAVEALARSPDLSADEQTRALAALRALPRSMLNDLLAAALQTRLEPESAAQVLEELLAQAPQAEPSELAELTRWLNLQGQSERVLELIPAERALTADVLLLSRLDALANLKRWDEIDTLLDGAQPTLDPSAIEGFHARAAIGRGATLGADLHWDRAISLAGKDGTKLRFIANFAEQSDATTAALKAYEQLGRFPEQAQFANRGRQRLLVKRGDAEAARASAQRLAAMAPDDPNAQAELLHFNLLLSHEVDANAEKARALAAKFPTRLSFRVTAALGYLRKGDAAVALAQFEGPPIDWPRTPPGWRAVYAGVLLANDRDDEARVIIDALPLDQLNGAERELIAGL